ncbi:MAG: hypothetical protein Q8904_02645 [Bacteroidota bacterium]|nr:hypothetical protein [Bacteroidota bacterium]
MALIAGSLIPEYESAKSVTTYFKSTNNEWKKKGSLVGRIYSNPIPSIGLSGKGNLLYIYN